MSDEITRIVKLLQQRGGLTQEELSDLSGTIKKLRNAVAEPTKTEYKLILNERAATVIWANGFSVAFHLDGSVHCAMEGTPTDYNSITKLNIEFGALEACIKHINDIKEKKSDVYAAKCYNKGKNDAGLGGIKEEGKTRWLQSGNKKAFVAGMIFGRKNP